MHLLKQSGWRLAAALPLILLVAVFAADLPNTAERLEQHRNLGKAFYENPTTQAEAVAEFKAALALAPQSNREKLNYGLALLRAGKVAEGVALLKEVQRADPKLPHTWFNLGIQYKKSGESAQSLAQFEQMAKLTPDEPVVHYQLGTLYKLQDNPAAALQQFETAAKLNPLLAAAQFQLYNLYRQEGRREDAARALETFQRLKKEAEGAAIAEDVDWCNYAEIYDPPREVTAPAIPPTAPPADRVTIDSTGAGESDLLSWAGGELLLLRRGVERVANPGFGDLKGVLFAAPGDFDNDGQMDLCVLTESGPVLFRNDKGKFTPVDAALPKARFERAVWIDYDHDYDLDLVLLGATQVLLRNQGKAGFADRTADFPFTHGVATDAFKLRVDPDSKAFDLAVLYRDRAPVLYRDQTGGRYVVAALENRKPAAAPVERVAPCRRWIRVQLRGVKSLKLAQDAEVEVKAGTLYRRQTYNGVPLLFDVGNAVTVDTVRITWPNGLIQNEVKQATNRAHSYEEAQRLSGSCPMIWTWNGKEFEFITDVLGVAPLGASDGDGSYFPVDHDEYVFIPGRSLKAVDGKYEVRVTEELSEVSYLDQIQLIAVDHPAVTEIFTNEKFKAPPFPEFRLYSVDRRTYPQTARDDAGRDVLPLLLKKDGRYPVRFPRSKLGVAPVHTLDLDFTNSAPAENAILFLNGWVDWPDGSTFRAASQESKAGLLPPYLQMQDAAGRWVTVNPDMGMPAGKPKTIAVPIKWLSAARKIRIVTSLCVYWDEVFLAGAAGPRHADSPQLEDVPPLTADLHFRGFSAARIDPDRKQPDTFFYGSVSPLSFWNPTPGFYTRYGDVKPLLSGIDDRLVIMGSGDELRLRFDAAKLPPVPQGWTRDFLLKVDGWAKDRDPNTAFSTTVEPLPFHGMSRYPYPISEHFPDDEAHARYRRDYNTRPALRLIRPLGGTN